MSDFNLARPEYLSLLLVPAFYLALTLGVGYLRRRRLAAVSEWAQFIRLLPEGYRRRSLWSGLFFALALVLIVLGLARPRYGREAIAEVSGGVDLCIAFDLSRSMYAQDVPPNRLVRARSEVDELLEKFRGGRICTVVFAGTADVYPLTSDRDAVRFFLRDLVPEDMPVGGTSLSRALLAGVRALTADDENFKAKELVRPPKAILLVTDGEETAGGDMEEALQAAREAGVKVFTLGVGGKTPEPIPEIRDGKMVGYYKDGEARTSLDEEMLRRLAEETGGRYVPLEQGLGPVRTDLYAMGEGFWEEQERQALAERYGWLFVPAALLLLAEIFISRRRRIGTW